MATFMDPAGVERLAAYFSEIGDLLGRELRRASFAVYAMGLLGDGERKSSEPMATRGVADPDAADAAHQRLLHFISDSNWSDRAVRRRSAAYALTEMTKRGPVEAWIVDDTGFLKQGRHSVGVQRQYTGSAGKIANCQIGVSLSVTTRDEHVPIDFELYVPVSWADDADRRKKAKIPDALVFKTKPQIALDMIRRAVDDGVAPGVVLGDSAYGSSSEFREGVRRLGLDFGVGVDPKTTVWVLDSAERPRGETVQVRDLAHRIHDAGGFRRCTWRKGTNADLAAKFAARRVVTAHDDGWARDERERLWLIIEWRDGEDEPSNYFLSSLPRRMTRKQLVRVLMQRWRTERVYEDLKGELGLDHFEGRSFKGWHHHISVALGLIHSRGRVSYAANAA